MLKKSEKLDEILGFGPFFRSPGAAEVAVDFQELPVRDAQQAELGAGLLNWRFVGGVSCRCPQWCSSGRTFLVAPC